MPLHVSSTCAHHQEVKIALHSFWYHHTYRWPSRAQVERGPLVNYWDKYVYWDARSAKRKKMQYIVTSVTDIGIYVKSVLRSTVLMFGTYHTDKLYLREHLYGGSVLILRSQQGPASKTFWETIYCKSTIYFRRHNNIIVYLLSFNITYIIILATCFVCYESSSGLNFKNYCTYCFTVSCLTVFV